VFGGLTAYIASIQQIIFDVFGAPGLIGLVFAAIAAPMAVASWGNSRVVGRFGLRRTGHAGLIAFVSVTAAHMLIAEMSTEPLWLFVVMMGMTFVAFASPRAISGRWRCATWRRSQAPLLPSRALPARSAAR